MTNLENDYRAPKTIKATGRGKTAKEKIMDALLDATWYEVPIEIDEMITRGEFICWKDEWYAAQEYRWNDYPGGEIQLAMDLYKVAVILPTGEIVFDRERHR
jgi:hypothetical protein